MSVETLEPSAPFSKRIIPVSDEFGTLAYDTDPDVLLSMRGVLQLVMGIADGQDSSGVLDGGDALYPAEVAMFTSELARVQEEARRAKLDLGRLGVLDAVQIAKYIQLFQATPKNQDVLEGAVRRFQDSTLTLRPERPNVRKH